MKATTESKTHSFKIDLPTAKSVEWCRGQDQSNSLKAFFGKLLNEERTRRDRERERRLARLRELQRFD